MPRETLPVLVLADNTSTWPADPTDLSRRPALILSLGDLYASDIAFWKPWNVPVIGVYGNHCTPGYLGRGDLAQGRIAATARVGEAMVLGVAGCVRYREQRVPDEPMYTQAEYTAALAPIHGPLDVVATHCPPRGVNDGPDPAHEGIDALADLVRRTRPAMLLHGHTYPETPVTEFEGCRIEYVSGHRLIDIPLGRHSTGGRAAVAG